MEKIINFLEKNNVGIVATSQNNKPHGRPQHIHLIRDGKFYFTTANVKKAYGTADNPIFEVFYLQHGETSYSNLLSGEPSENFTF